MSGSIYILLVDKPSGGSIVHWLLLQCYKLRNLIRRGHAGNIQSAENVSYFDCDVQSLGEYTC